MDSLPVLFMFLRRRGVVCYVLKHQFLLHGLAVWTVIPFPTRRRLWWAVSEDIVALVLIKVYVYTSIYMCKP